MPFDEEILFDMTRIIDIETEIYDIMVEKLPFFEIEKKLDTVEYKQTMRRLELLKSKEQTMMENIDFESNYHTSAMATAYCLQGRGISNVKKKAIISRISELLAGRMLEIAREKMRQQVRKEVYEKLGKDIDISQSEIVFVPALKFSSRFKIQFLKYLQKENYDTQLLTETKYLLAFKIPTFDKEFGIFDYNLDNYIELSSELDAAFNMRELNEYEEKLVTARFNYTEEVFADFIELSCNEETTKEQMNLAFEEAKFAGTILDTAGLFELYNKYLFDDFNDNLFTNMTTEYVESLRNFLGFELSNRDDIHITTMLYGIEKRNDSLNITTRDELLKILQTTSKIHEILSKLLSLEIDGQSDSEEFKTAFSLFKCINEFKNELSSNFEYDPKQSKVIADLIREYIDTLSFKNTFDEAIDYSSLEAHIMNIIFNFDQISDSIYRDSSIPYYIRKNYLLECLEEYENIDSDAKDEYIRFKYSEILAEPVLTDEFVLTEGDLSKSMILDDETTSMILGIDLDEYLYDKNNFMTIYAHRAVEVLSQFPDDPEIFEYAKAIFDFETTSLKLALNGMYKDDVDSLSKNYLNKVKEENIVTKEISKILDSYSNGYQKVNKKRH